MCFGIGAAIANTVQAGMWVAIVIGGLALLRRGGGGGRRRTRSRGPSAIDRSVDILNGRYARGEIDRDEYLERRAYLS